MCGGRVEMIPCAVAAHMFKSHTYAMASKNKGGSRYNTDRIAEIWLDDEYKKYYYNVMGHTKDRNYGDISERLELKKKLRCKSFKWFLETLHPKMPIPENVKDFDEQERIKNEEQEKKKAEEAQKRKQEEENKRQQEEQRRQLDEEVKRKEEEQKIKEEEEKKKNL